MSTFLERVRALLDMVSLSCIWNILVKISRRQARDFPGGPVVKTPALPMQGARVPSLVGELRSRGLCCMAKKKKKKKGRWRASLVAQWLRIRLPMQRTRVRALVWEDPTCRGATGPVSHNYWACASGACALQQERPRQWEARAPRWRVAPARRN